MAKESQLVDNLANGNIVAFNILYKRYSQRLYCFALGYLKSEVEAEEVVQEVFIKIWEKRALLKQELSFKSFLFTIAFNTIKKHFRTKAYMLKYSIDNSQYEADNQTSEKIAYDSTSSYVYTLAKKLPVRRQEIFIKSRFHGLSIKEISEELNISHKTVENQLTEALKFIRKKLKDEISS